MAKRKEVKELELGVAIPKPKLQWESGIYTMKEVLKTFSLPRVIRCDPCHFDLPIDHNSFNMAQPIMLFRQRTIRKLVANNVTYDKRLGKFVEIGNPLLIPQDYKGWFAYFGNPDTLTTDQEIPIYTTIQNIAASGTTEFLIGGKQEVIGLKMASNASSPQNMPDSRTVFPGDVLKVAGVYVATTKCKKKKVFGNKIITTEEKFLLCVDEGDRELLLPFGAKGQFHVISSSKNNLSVPVVQLNNVNRFPCILKLVFGRSPSTPCSFTGTLLLTGSFMEDSVISSTVFNVRNVLIEIPIETVLKYNVAKNDTKLIKNKGYKEALLLCKERADIYMRQMKVSLVMPDFPDESDTMSIYSGPEHPPPLPPSRDRKTSLPVSHKRLDYEQVFLPKPTSTSHLEMLGQRVPIQSSSAVRLCLGNNAVNIAIESDGSIRMPSRAARSSSLREGMFSPPMYDVPNVTKVSKRHDDSPTSPRSTAGDSASSESSDVVNYENVELIRKALKKEIDDLPPPIPCRAPLYRLKAEDFQTSPFDNLPLGASAVNTSFDSMSVCSVPDSGVGVDTVDTTCSELSGLSVNDVQAAFRQLGIKDDSLLKLKAQKIDGKALQEMDIDSLQESLPFVKKLELRKIALFIKTKGQSFF